MHVKHNTAREALGTFTISDEDHYTLGCQDLIKDGETVGHVYGVVAHNEPGAESAQMLLGSSQDNGAETARASVGVATLDGLDEDRLEDVL